MPRAVRFTVSTTSAALPGRALVSSRCCRRAAPRASRWSPSRARGRRSGSRSASRRLAPCSSPAPRRGRRPRGSSVRSSRARSVPCRRPAASGAWRPCGRDRSRARGRCRRSARARSLGGAGAPSAAATSRIPKPVCSSQPRASTSRADQRSRSKSCVLSRSGRTVQTQLAAPATSGDEELVPFNEGRIPGGLRGRSPAPGAASRRTSDPLGTPGVRLDVDPTVGCGTLAGNSAGFRPASFPDARPRASRAPRPAARRRTGAARTSANRG